jgi:hypothetical protein
VVAFGVSTVKRGNKRRCRCSLDDVPMFIDPAHMLAIKVAQETDSQLASHNLVLALARSTACWTNRHIDLIAFCVANFPCPLRRSRTGQIRSNVFEVLAGNATIFKSELELLLALRTESIVAWSLGDIVSGHFSQPLDLMPGGASPDHVSVLKGDLVPCSAQDTDV